MPNIVVDADAPIILQSQLTSGISRYHLDEVEIGINIDEPQSWSSNLSLSCQVRSTGETWEVITLSRGPSTIFDGKTMFAFNFDFSNSGDPSQLSNQAQLACWAEGFDDSGWPLDSVEGNSQLSPWLVSTLNDVGPDLELGDISVSGDAVAGSKLSIKVQLINGGENIQSPFNLSIFVVQNDEKTMVGRLLQENLGENTAIIMNSRITVPKGKWTLLISVDDEQLIWELDEENNVWTKEYSGEEQGFSTITIALAGGGISTLIGAAIYLSKRKENLDQLVNQSNSDSTKGEPPAIDAKSKPKKGPPGKAKPSGGPPGKPKPKNGPPGVKSSSGPSGGPPNISQTAALEQPEVDLQATAAAHFGALDSLITENTESPEEATQTTLNPISTTVADWSELPGGGEYDYSSDATYYSGETCGKWLLNEDKSFTRIE